MAGRSIRIVKKKGPTGRFTYITTDRLVIIGANLTRGGGLGL